MFSINTLSNKALKLDNTEIDTLSFKHVLKEKPDLQKNQFVNFFFLFSIWLDDPHLTNEHRTQDCIAN